MRTINLSLFSSTHESRLTQDAWKRRTRATSAERVANSGSIHARVPAFPAAVMKNIQRQEGENATASACEPVAILFIAEHQLSERGDEGKLCAASPAATFERKRRLVHLCITMQWRSVP